MSITSSSLMVERTDVCPVLEQQRRAVIMSITVRVPPSTGHECEQKSSSHVLWALTVPRPEISFADGFYSVTKPIPLGVVDSAAASRREGATVSSLRWDLSAGSRTALLLTPTETPLGKLQAVLEGALGMPLSAPSPSIPLLSVRWSLLGTEVVSSDILAEAEWRPLLHRRWYELKDYVRRGTVVPYYASAALSRAAQQRDKHCRSICGGTTSDVPSSKHLHAGEVKEAVAVSLNHACVMWSDGTVGLSDEVTPFARVYQPARPEKVVRVRRFPHRYADVVGEVPFGQCVRAFGRTSDPFTSEQYVLLYLPAGRAFAAHIATYDLTFIEEGCYVWGWSKLAGTSGLPLLVEAEDAERRIPMAEALRDDYPVTLPRLVTGIGASKGGSAKRLPLPEPTFYTPVRDGHSVRIRKKPTLTSSTLREMEANEVLPAVAVVIAPLRIPSDPSGITVAHTFVEWQHGGYSLLQNATESFLMPLQLSRVPRRFPLRTKSCNGDGADRSEIVDLSGRHYGKRQRDSSPVRLEDEEASLAEWLRPQRATETMPDASLLSPHTLPASLQDALQKGVVRLEDLPALGEDSESSECSDEDSSSDCTADSQDGFGLNEDF